MTLEINNLYKAFGSTQALKGMDFTVRPGELYGFVGSNGAGKTTTMRIALGVLEADSGEVLLNGKPLTFEDRRGFGYMPEERGLYPRMKVSEQLVYLAQLHGKSKAEAEAAMEYWTERLGVAARRDDLVQELSLGNQQRVQLSAALVHDPDVLILDEPFSGLDPVAVDAMSKVLRDKADAGATVVFSSHQLDLVERLCDRIGICSLGRIVSEGTIDELRVSDQPQIDVIADAGENALREVLTPLGVTVSEISHLDYDAEAGAVRLTLPGGLDDQEALKAIASTGPVRKFAPYRPHLAELFKDVVELPTPEPDEPKKKKGLAALFGRK